MCWEVKMYLLVFTALVAVASANPTLLGSNKCTYGPSYWCSHIKHAKECGAMEHCISAVWKYNTVEVKDEPKCEMCIFAVTEARKLIKDKATEEEMANFLSKACSLIPEKSLKTKCEQIVKDYLPEIIQLLTSEVDPKAVCTALRMCTAQLTEEKTPDVTTKGQPDLCADCKKFTADVEKMLKDNKTQAQIEEYLDQMCKQLGPMEDMCKQLVAQYVPNLLNMLISEFNPNVFCRMLGLCNSGNLKDALEFRFKFLELVKKIPVINDIRGPEECNICKEVMGEIQKLDRDARTQKAIENILEQNICPLFGTSENECKQLIQEYAPMLFEYLANELDPDVACKALHICTAVDHSEKPITALSVPAKPLFKSQPAKKPLKKSKASTYCVLCEFIMKELDALLSQNASREEVTSALEAVCARLPDTISAECKAFVDQYAPAVIALLVAELDPTKVCQTLGLCSRFSVALPKANPELCEVCKLIVQYVDSILKQNGTVQDIIEVLEKICNFLPATLKTECDNIVETYGPVIAQLIAQLADPTKVCSSIGLCTNSTMTNPVKKYENHIEQMTNTDSTLYFKNLDTACLAGPGHWCQNEETANKCGTHALKYCRRHVWVN